MASLDLPESQSTVQVSIIDTTTRMRDIPASSFFGPDLKGFERFSAGAFSFLVTHTDVQAGKQSRIIFDLGPSANWIEDYADPVVERVKSWGADIQVSKHVADILEENGVPADSIDAVVWSHTHWDHIGHMPTFPFKVSLVLGPGVKKTVYPGYKSNVMAPFREGAIGGRKIIELDFERSPIELGGFKAMDWFGDGSFYLLSAPGHCTGHINALARTTAPSTATSDSTYIFMAADSFHHGSQIRPTSMVPLPSDLSVCLPDLPPDFINQLHKIHPSHRKQAGTVAGHFTNEIDMSFNDPSTTPYLSIALKSDGTTIASNRPAALATLKGIQRYDADDDVLVVAAHDYTLFDVLDFFPATANEWKMKGWKERGRWRFLNDFRKAVALANGATNGITNGTA